MPFPSFIVTLKWQYKYLILHKQALFSSGGSFSSLSVTLEGNNGVVVGLYVLVLWWSERCSRDLPAAFQIAHEVKQRLMAGLVPSAQGQDQGPLQNILKVTRWSVIVVIDLYVSLWHYCVDPSSPSHQSAGASEACKENMAPSPTTQTQRPQPVQTHNFLAIIFANHNSFVIRITLQMENTIKKKNIKVFLKKKIIYLVRCWKLRVKKLQAQLKPFFKAWKCSFRAQSVAATAARKHLPWNKTLSLKSDIYIS